MRRSFIACYAAAFLAENGPGEAPGFGLNREPIV